MAEYNPPNEILPIWNTSNFLYGASNLTIDTANGLYIKKTGADIAVGPITIKNQLYMSNGSVSLPSISFTNSTTSGLYLISSNSVGFATNGVNRLTIDNANITSTNPVRATVFQSTTFGGPNAVYGNSTNTQTGIYFPTSTTVGVVQNGIYTLTLATGQIIPFNPIRAQNGSSVVPTYSFNNSADSGLYLVAPNYVGMSIGTDTIQTWEGKFTKFWGNDTGNNVGYTPSPFGYYEEYAYTTKFYFTGGGITPNINCKITRIGNLITLYIPQWTSNAITNNSGGTRQCFTNTNIPTRFLPGTSLPILVSRAVVNSVDILINMYIQSGGAGASILTIEKNIATYFANNDIFYMYGTTMSWLL